MTDLDDKRYKDLYKFKRIDSKLNSKVKESDNIQSIHQWLRKIEDVSEKAINNTFNPKVDLKNSNKTKSTSNLFNTDRKTLVEIQSEICNKPEPYQEAHDLLNQWVADKIRLDIDDDIYNYVDVNEINTFNNNERELKKLKSELMESSNYTTNDILDIKGIDYDKYDEEYLAKDVINRLMKKNIVDPNKLVDKPNKPRFIDTGLKIELRHQVVKENREKRLRDLEARRKENLEKKEIELKAKQMVHKEEQEKKARAEIEKQLIEQEAQRLRLEMAQKRQRDEEMRRKRKEMEQIRMEREKQDLSNIQKQLELSQIENEIEMKKSEMAIKRAEDLADSYLKAKNIKRVRKLFSSWYGIILDLRIKNGKAKALADWKLSAKIFYSWKKLGITEKVKKEQEIHEHFVKNENIRNAQASNFYNKKLIIKFFEEWKNFTKSQLISKQMESERLTAKSRMQKFLDAVAEGKIGETDDNSMIESNMVTTRTNQSITDLRRSKSFDNLASENNSYRPSSKSSSKIRVKIRKNNESRNSNRSEKLKDVSFLDLSESEMATLEASKYSESDLNKKVKDMMWPWVKSPFAINNFDNRFKAQEKLLHEQHEMIRAQQKLIDDLKFQQSKIAFKEQIALLEQIKAKQLDLEKMQKTQYKQEKELLRKKAEIMRMQKDKKPPTGRTGTDNQNEDVVNDINDTERQDTVKNEATDKNSASNLNSTRTNQTSSRTNQTSGRSNSTMTDTSEVKQLDQFVKNMEERAKMREQLKREREEKKRKQEMEKLELLRAQQEEKLKVEEEERKKKAEELKEKRKIQQKLDEKRNAEKIKEQKAIEKADNFYKKYLLRYYCMNGFKQLIEQRNEKLKMACKHHSLKVCGKIFISWKIVARTEAAVKEKIADQFYAKFLLKNYYFSGVKLFKQALAIEMAKAGRFYRYNIKLKLFQNWKVYTNSERKKSREHEHLIERHNLNRIVRKYFRVWKDYPAELRRLKAREKRLEELRNRVREFIPDFEPPQASNQSSIN